MKGGEGAVWDKGEFTPEATSQLTLVDDVVFGDEILY